MKMRRFPRTEDGQSHNNDRKKQQSPNDQHDHPGNPMPSALRRRPVVVRPNAAVNAELAAVCQDVPVSANILPLARRTVVLPAFRTKSTIIRHRMAATGVEACVHLQRLFYYNVWHAALPNRNPRGSCGQQ